MAVPLIQPARVTWTIRDLEIMPDDGHRYEVLDGDLLVSRSPTTTHQTVSKRLQRALMEQIEDTGAGVVFDAPLDVIFSDTRCVQPDLIAIRAARRNIITERGIFGPPDLVIEILSPSTAQNDLELKRKLFATVGVPEYWIADPARHTVDVLELAGQGYVLRGSHGPGATIESGVFAVRIAIDPIFAA